MQSTNARPGLSSDHLQRIQCNSDSACAQGIGNDGSQSTIAGQSALAEFVRAAEQYRPRLLWVARRLVNCQDEAEDIVQHALLKACVKLDTFRGESRMSTWLNAIVLNTALEYRRSRRGKFTFSLDTSVTKENGWEDLEIADHSPSPEEQYEKLEAQEVVARALDRMSFQDRRVLTMCLLEELPYLQVATALEVSISALKSQVFRGKKRLRSIISPNLRQAI